MFIGSWGSSIIFTVSGIRTKTFSEITQESTGRWVEHNVISGSPISEFLGPGLDQIRITAIFSLRMGVDPTRSYERIRESIRSGEYHPLILGGRVVSDNDWYCTNIRAISSVFEPVTGASAWSECEIELREYR